MKTDARVELQPLQPSDREQFIHDNQEAFNYGALEEFGRRDDHFEEDGEIISHETIEASIDSGEAYRILLDGEKSAAWCSRSTESAAILNCCSFPRASTAGASAMPRGARWSACTRRCGYGRRSHHTLNSGTFIFM